MSEIKNTTTVSDSGQQLIKDFGLSTIENPVKQITVDFAKLANSKNRLAHDALSIYIENDHDQITITGIPDGSWNSVNSISVGLVNSKTGKPVALKTAGVYVTKINKILDGVNPHDRVNFKASRMFADFILLQNTPDSVRVVHTKSDKSAIVCNNGSVTCDDFNLFNAAITDLLNPLPDRVFNRFYAGIESDNGKIELCQFPTLVIEFADIRVALANDKPESIDAAKGALMVKLLAAGVNFTGSDIAELTPTIDGTDTWVDEKIKNNWYKSVKKSD